MYVCVCNAVTEDDVRGCMLDGGCGGVREVKDACGWKPGCGSCTRRLYSLVSEVKTAVDLVDAITGGPLPPVLPADAPVPPLGVPATSAPASMATSAASDGAAASDSTTVSGVTATPNSTATPGSTATSGVTATPVSTATSGVTATPVSTATLGSTALGDTATAPADGADQPACIMNALATATPQPPCATDAPGGTPACGVTGSVPSEVLVPPERVLAPVRSRWLRDTAA
ncbi:(2Fe-2S)-binding protein [Spirillospora sp. NPDC052269]